MIRLNECGVKKKTTIIVFFLTFKLAARDVVADRPDDDRA